MLNNFWERFLRNPQAQIVAVCAVACMIVSFTVAIISFVRRSPEERDVVTFTKYMLIAGGVTVVVVAVVTAILVFALKTAKPFEPFY